jgi:hypothetical protein
MHKMSVQQIESAFPIQSVKRPQQPEEQTERIHKSAMRRVNPTRIKDYGSAIGSLPRNSLRSQPTVTGVGIVQQGHGTQDLQIDDIRQRLKTRTDKQAFTRLGRIGILDTQTDDIQSA